VRSREPLFRVPRGPFWKNVAVHTRHAATPVQQNDGDASLLPPSPAGAMVWYCRTSAVLNCPVAALVLRQKSREGPSVHSQSCTRCGDRPAEPARGGGGRTVWRHSRTQSARECPASDGGALRWAESSHWPQRPRRGRRRLRTLAVRRAFGGQFTKAGGEQSAHDAGVDFLGHRPDPTDQAAAHATVVRA
jgi:hypothetical protein